MLAALAAAAAGVAWSQWPVRVEVAPVTRGPAVEAHVGAELAKAGLTAEALRECVLARYKEGRRDAALAEGVGLIARHAPAGRR